MIEWPKLADMYGLTSAGRFFNTEFISRKLFACFYDSLSQVRFSVSARVRHKRKQKQNKRKQKQHKRIKWLQTGHYYSLNNTVNCMFEKLFC